MKVKVKDWLTKQKNACFFLMKNKHSFLLLLDKIYTAALVTYQK